MLEQWTECTNTRTSLKYLDKIKFYPTIARISTFEIYDDKHFRYLCKLAAKIKQRSKMYHVCFKSGERYEDSEANFP
jgi:hypothetical protein